MNIHRLALAFCLPYVAVCNAGAAGASVSQPQSVPQLVTRNSTGTRAPSGASPQISCHCITYRIAHSFGNGDGEDPCGRVIDVNGVLYGTTYDPGYYPTTPPVPGYPYSINLATSKESVYGFSGTTKLN